MSKEKILIVSYTFPPDTGIGGKRWSKMSKYLADDKYDVHIICQKRKTNKALPDWLKKTNLTIHEIKGFYPSILKKTPTNLLEKVRYTFWDKILPLLHKGAIYDHSIFLKKSFLKKAESVISQHQISLVFVTCAPFYLSYYATLLKRTKSFFLVVDFRDPWTWGQGYGYATLSKSRTDHDKSIERQVIEQADLITSPSTNILDHLKNDYGKIPSSKFLHISHAIDTEQFPLKREEYLNLKKPNSYKFIYAGTLYHGYSQFLSDLISVLQNMEIDFPEIYDQFVFDIYSPTANSIYKSQVAKSGLEAKIFFHDPIPEKQLFEILPNYNYSLLFFPEKFKNFISTKFIELVYVNLPILYIGQKGVVSEFIEENQLGLFFESKRFKRTFNETIVNIDPKAFKSDFDTEPFTFKTTASKLMKTVSQSRNN